MKNGLPAQLFVPLPPVPEGLRAEIEAIASGDLAAVKRVLAATGKLVGTVEAKHDEEGFVGSLLVPDDDPTSLTRDQAIQLLEAILGDLGDIDLHRALTALEAALGPAVHDLVFYPPKDFDNSSAAAIYDRAVLESERGDAEAAARPTLQSLRAARIALAEMAEMEEVELSFGEEAARILAMVVDEGTSLDTIAAWAQDPENRLGEVFADDEALLERVQAGVAAAEEKRLGAAVRAKQKGAGKGAPRKGKAKTPADGAQLGLLGGEDEEK